MVIYPRVQIKVMPAHFGLGITIPFPRVNNHSSKDPSGIIYFMSILFYRGYK